MCMYVFVYTHTTVVSSSCHACLKRPSLMHMCVYMYVCIHTHMCQIIPCAVSNSSFSILSHTCQLLLVVTVDYLAFPNSFAVAHTLTGCASQPAGMPVVLPWLCSSKFHRFKYLFEMYPVTRLGRERQWSEAFPMRIELNPIWSNANPESSNVGSVFK